MRHRTASIPTFGGCHSIQLSYERVTAFYCSLVTATNDWGVMGGERIGDGHYFRQVDLTRSESRVSDVVFSTRARYIHNRRRERSRARATDGIHARSHNLQLADRNVLPGASESACGLRSFRPRWHIFEAAVVTVAIRLRRPVCQSPRNRMSSSFVALYVRDMRSGSLCRVTSRLGRYG